MPRDNAARRKIYFYRVEPTGPSVDDSWTLPRSAIAERLSGLEGDAFYLDEGADRITCAEVHGAKAPQQIKFYGIRRRNLPSRDDGGGQIVELGLREKEGLAEAVHVVLFPNSIIGFESFFYGPRISRIESFINLRCEDDLAGPISIKQLYRGDMIERALQYTDIRVLRVKMRPNAPIPAGDKDLVGVLEAANALHAAKYADVTFRTESHDERFSDRVKRLLWRLKQEKVDPSAVFEGLDVSGRNPESGEIEPLNILNDALQRVVYIPRKDERTRALDSTAAFSAIREAYHDVKEDLPNDAVEA